MSTSAFVSAIAGCSGAYTVGLDRAKAPWQIGDTVLAHGVFGDGTETDLGAFLVVRKGYKGWWTMSPLGTVDDYWKDHLQKNLQVEAKVLWSETSKPEENCESFRRWRVVAGFGEEPPQTELNFLGKTGFAEALKTWRFVTENVMSEVPQAKDLMTGSQPKLR